MGDMVNTTINETSDYNDLIKDVNVIKTQNYVNNRDEYSTMYGNLGQEFLNYNYSTYTGIALNNIAYNQVNANLQSYSPTILANTQTFSTLDKSQGAHRQLNNNEVGFLTNDKNIEAFAKIKYATDNPTPEQLQGAKYTLAQTAISLVDDNWKEILGGNIDNEAKSFLETNVDSIKNVTTIEKANSAQGLANIANNEQNLEYYKTYIQSGAKGSLSEVINKNIEKQTAEAINTIEKIDKNVFGNIVDKIGDYIRYTSLENMSEDVKDALYLMVENMQKGVVKANDTIELTPEQISKVYNISQEEATQVKNTIIIVGYTAVAGVLKDGSKDLVKLGIPNEVLKDSLNNFESLSKKLNIDLTPEIKAQQQVIVEAEHIAKSSNYKDANGRWIWPDNTKDYDAIPGTLKDVTLKKGDVLVRYVQKDGKSVSTDFETGVHTYLPNADTGTYTTIKGQSWESLSLPGKESDYVKFEIEVTQDITAKQSLATPWFDQPGQGIQIKLDGQIKELMKDDPINMAKLKIK